ncbi:substrate-binding periplasmic protein [Chitinimonas sp. BJB300]|uniref:substrate-binding periplasmic protein n=1 Tax=Chitinimonas sp. BJB300 TaxID=1559339 RepID=UPI000C0E56D7|nr:transporter substrate-binding domain-containing protein [Chitinimonas sp. BJB300]PHV11191.1 hypothetical protein CSQ89_12130 [Chitinimonas sp. BJB300]TSJ89028.1 transporter substrate-binding domain-containing protein [Chitinimonas sp. BJB300]
MKRLLCAVLPMVLAAQVAEAAESLRFGVTLSSTMPDAKFQGERLVGGIMYDLGQALSIQLAMKVSFVTLPWKRVDSAVRAGKADLLCELIPQWTVSPDEYVWSGPLFDLSDVIFAHETTPEPKTIADMPVDSTIGGVLGYHYPALDPFFSNGRYTREDAVTQQSVILKLAAGRTKYGISDALVLSWYKRINPNHHLSGWQLVISRVGSQCGVPLKGKVPPEKIINALQELKRNGSIEKILNNYR